MAVGLTTCADLLLASHVPGREPGVQGLGAPVHSRAWGPLVLFFLCSCLAVSQFLLCSTFTSSPACKNIFNLSQVNLRTH